ncbi:hypothetical protein [Nonlabens ponticola]|uniref:Uncharacterized protein n=1 Tax=Nonlabens ponticola TaxID=2496866 RepID=A0A3S9MUE9_9FLAO|nr:hypothetical protein [Nonlabens ponticola]AZQ42807.1 hypothetical protein EJ995_00605 [Nonlabens ponticola]
MESKPNPSSKINKWNIASMVILLLILLFFLFKGTLEFQTQKWIYLILGLILVFIDVMRIRLVIKSGQRRLLFVRIVTLIMVIGFLIYWLYLHFL